MSPNLSTQIQRAVFALPLLAIALAAGIGAGTRAPSGMSPPADAASTGDGIVEAPERTAGTLVIVLPARGIAIAVPGVPSAPQGAATTLPGTAGTLPGDALLATGVAARLDCDADEPAGARGLARMPGDISTFAGRMRCAQ